MPLLPDSLIDLSLSRKLAALRKQKADRYIKAMAALCPEYSELRDRVEGTGNTTEINYERVCLTKDVVIPLPTVRVIRFED